MPDDTPVFKIETTGSVRLEGWKRVLPVIVQHHDGTHSYRILWGHASLWALGAALVAYLLLVTALWAFLVYQRGITETRFTDLLIPARWQVQNVRAGDHYIATARQQIEAGEYREALLNLHLGLAKSPANTSGRILLAQLYAAAHRFDTAAQTLSAGLPFSAHDQAFLQTFFSFLLEQQSDDAVRTHARELLAQPQFPAAQAPLVALAAASASYFRGNYDEADGFIATYHLDRAFEGRLLSAQIEWERGYRELAVLRLQQLTDEAPANDAARQQLASWLRELGQTAEFRRLTLLRQLAQPNQPGPRIELLRALRIEAPERLPAETAELLRQSTNDERLLLALADFAAETGDAELARRAYLQCRQLNRGWEAAAFLNVEALIVARDYRGALELTRQLLEENRDWAKRYYALFNSLQSIAYYGLGDASSAQLYLTNFLGLADLRADNLLAVAQRFIDVGARHEARETLAHAVAADPLNQAALTRLIQLDLDLNQVDALPPHLRRLLAMRRPSPAVLRAAQTKLGSDLFLFSRERDETLVALQRALASVR